ncbi:MAG: pentapeptide repeat-containing protein [Pseudonocardiaceae bacterium]
MTARSSRPDEPPPKPLPRWNIWLGTLGVLAVAAVVWFVLLRRYGGQGAQVQLDAIRTAGTLVIGTGGAVALLLTARRQRYTELALVHTDRDATERRITELYTKAAELLGSDQAPVRLAGLYALERLAHSTAEHRQTVVDVICAYLRMPYTPLQRSYRSPGLARRRRVRPLSDRPACATPTSLRSGQERAEQELQVRPTAQNILYRNFSRDGPHRLRWWYPVTLYLPTWEGIQLDLTEARLLEFSLSQCRLWSADFTRAQFTGKANFELAEFDYEVSFKKAQFTGEANFSYAQFAVWGDFRSHKADFENAQFAGRANFEYATFTRRANFEGATFSGGATFRGAEFPYFQFLPVWRRWAFSRLGRSAIPLFGGFLGPRADFKPGETSFDGARVASTAEPGSVWPPGWTTRPAKPDNGEDSAFLYLTKVEESPLPDA